MKLSRRRRWPNPKERPGRNSRFLFGDYDSVFGRPSLLLFHMAQKSKKILFHIIHPLANLKIQKTGQLFISHSVFYFCRDFSSSFVAMHPLMSWRRYFYFSCPNPAFPHGTVPELISILHFRPSCEGKWRVVTDRPKWNFTPPCKYTISAKSGIGKNVFRISVNAAN